MLEQVEQVQWYVIRTKQNAEKRVLERLVARNFEVFLPQYETIRIWSDRKKKLKVPLIPSHLFIHCSQRDLTQVYGTPGIVTILSEFGKPAIVRPVEIQNMRVLCALEQLPDLQPLENWITGTEVEVTEGPFTGLVGVVSKDSKSTKVHIAFHHLGMGAVLKYTQVQSTNSIS